MTLDRRQRWAAFSVKAHRDVAALASDVLLYERIVLPVPADDPEYDRWVRKKWAPDAIALRTVQAGGIIIPVPWTAELREEWSERWKSLKQFGDEVAYGLTGQIYAGSPKAWEEIAASLQSDELPERKPSIVAGYQSEEEARAELALVPPHPSPPGTRPADRAVALWVQRLVEEPAIDDPEEAFLAAVALASKPAFQKARRSLFDLEDALYLDDWQPDEVEKKLATLEEEYRDLVRSEIGQTRRRVIGTLLPKAGGWAITAAGHPHAKGVVSKSLSLVMGRFFPAGNPIKPEEHPGAAMAMIRAAYRRATPER